MAGKWTERVQQLFHQMGRDSVRIAHLESSWLRPQMMRQDDSIRKLCILIPVYSMAGIRESPFLGKSQICNCLQRFPTQKLELEEKSEDNATDKLEMAFPQVRTKS